MFMGMFTGKKRAIYGVIVVSLMVTGSLLASRTTGCNYDVCLPTATATPDDHKFSEYKGITIGLTAEDVRKKLGSPKDKSDEQDLYVFSGHESAQFYYDAGHLVTAIMITYSGDLKDAPTAKDVFGEDVPANADGGIFKMERYPKAGYWISYNRTAGDDAVVSIAMQKI